MIEFCLLNFTLSEKLNLVLRKRRNMKGTIVFDILDTLIFHKDHILD